MCCVFISVEAEELARQARAIEERAHSKAQAAKPAPSNTAPQKTLRKTPREPQQPNQVVGIHSEPAHIPGLTER